MSCPECNSDDWKSASLVHEAGIVNIDTSTTSAGVGLGVGGGGLGIGGGVASGKTTGQHQSNISAMAAPPTEPKNTVGPIFWLAVIGFAIMVSGKSGFMGFLVLVGGFFLWNKKKTEFKALHEKKVVDYKHALEQWEQTRMCQRCGCLYLPNIKP